MTVEEMRHQLSNFSFLETSKRFRNKTTLSGKGAKNYSIYLYKMDHFAIEPPFHHFKMATKGHYYY